MGQVDAAQATGARAAGTPVRARLSQELIAILAVGVMLAGLMVTMMTMMKGSFEREIGTLRTESGVLRTELGEVRADIRELRTGQLELRERMARVESKVDLLAGDWPPNRRSDTLAPGFRPTYRSATAGAPMPRA